MIALRTKSAWRPIMKSANTASRTRRAGVDQVGGSADADPERSIDPVHFDDGFLFIGQQDERQLVLGLEFGMRCRACGLMPTTRRPGRSDFRVQVAQRARLAGASGREIRG